MSGRRFFGVVMRTDTEERANKLAKKIVDLMHEAGIGPIQVDIYEFNPPDSKYPYHIIG